MIKLVRKPMGGEVKFVSIKNGSPRVEFTDHQVFLPATKGNYYFHHKIIFRDSFRLVLKNEFYVDKSWFLAIKVKLSGWNEACEKDVEDGPVPPPKTMASCQSKCGTRRTRETQEVLSR